MENVQSSSVVLKPDKPDPIKCVDVANIAHGITHNFQWGKESCSALYKLLKGSTYLMITIIVAVETIYTAFINEL